MDEFSMTAKCISLLSYGKQLSSQYTKPHPGQAGMIYLAQLIWYPQIHQDVVALAQRCKQCTKTGKNLKPIIPKNKHTSLPTLSEPKEEIQMNLAGQITNKSRDTYILVTIER